MTALAELVSIDTDTVPLDGLYYASDDTSSRGAVLFVHGNGMNFYYGVARFLPQYLIAAGFRVSGLQPAGPRHVVRPDS